MKNVKIRFVRTYNFYGIDLFDVIYASGRVVTKAVADMPMTVQQFICKAESKTEQYDRTFKRMETIYR